jgi:hypothetical protein
VSATDPTTASPLDRHASPVGERGKASGRATASLVCGIIGVLTSVFVITGLILGIIAVVLGQTSRSDCARKDRAAPWQSIAGLTLGILALVLSVGLVVVRVIVHS